MLKYCLVRSDLLWWLAPTGEGSKVLVPIHHIGMTCYTKFCTVLSNQNSFSDDNITLVHVREKLLCSNCNHWLRWILNPCMCLILIRSGVMCLDMRQGQRLSSRITLLSHYIICLKFHFLWKVIFSKAVNKFTIVVECLFNRQLS